jgi:predicted AlkP superfamily phosphohydrolase/phosphomutase
VRAIVFGIDGGGWNFLLNPSLSDSGEIFREISSNRPSGDLVSTVPPVTGPAWVSFATGCNPGEHGCYGFLLPEDGLSRTRPIDSRDISRPTFYEMLQGVGKKCILINLPCSYPPRIPGVVITGLMTAGNRYIYPRGLEDDLPVLGKYRPFPDQKLMARRKTREHLDDIRDVEEIRFKCARSLFETDWDFFFVLFSGVDWALHSISGSLDEAASRADVQDIVGDIGHYLSWFRENCPEDAYVLLVSDHGFMDYERTFYPNALLRDGGLLDLVEKEKGNDGPHRIFQEYSSESLNLRIPANLVSLLGRSPRLMEIAFKVLDLSPVQVKSSTGLVLSEDSKAACISPGMSNFGTLYLSPETSSNPEIVTEKLQGASDPAGEAIVERIWKRGEIYRGKSIDLGPQLIFKTRPGYWVNNDLTYPRASSTGRDINHGLMGIHSLVTDHGSRSGETSTASIEDIAPTILYNYGIPLPDWMDGRPIFRPGH